MGIERRFGGNDDGVRRVRSRMEVMEGWVSARARTWLPTKPVGPVRRTFIVKSDREQRLN